MLHNVTGIIAPGKRRGLGIPAQKDVKKKKAHNKTSNRETSNIMT
jgi:hypothetical protein